jgi:nickel transport protein
LIAALPRWEIPLIRGLLFVASPRTGLCALTLIGCVAYAAPASAHKVVVYATAAASGKAIQGEVYFHGGAAAQHVQVTLVGPDDEVLARSTTDREGKFTFPIRVRSNYRVIADAGEGHRAEWTVSAEELADDLPPAGGVDRAGSAPPGDEKSAAPGAPETDATLQRPAGNPRAEGPIEEAPGRVSGTGPAGSRSVEDLHEEIEALARQIVALRTELNRYNDRIGLRDYLGGIGYILGIMGVVFYFLGVRRKER